MRPSSCGLAEVAAHRDRAARADVDAAALHAHVVAGLHVRARTRRSAARASLGLAGPLGISSAGEMRVLEKASVPPSVGISPGGFSAVERAVDRAAEETGDIERGVLRRELRVEGERTLQRAQIAERRVGAAVDRAAADVGVRAGQARFFLGEVEPRARRWSRPSAVGSRSSCRRRGSAFRRWRDRSACRAR